MGFSFNTSTGSLDNTPSMKKGDELFSVYSSNSSNYLENVWGLVLALSGGNLTGNLTTPSPLIIQNTSSVQITDTISTQTNFITPRSLLKIIVNGENKVIKLFDDNN
jgi:hypothetical protein